MPDGVDAISVRVLTSIRDIDAAAWDALANADGSANPFVTHAFLAALERSGSAAADTGWAPAHLLLEENGEIIGAAPAYVKSHSQGEYVFDHHWADAYRRAGGEYYPKIVCAAPFTPVPGPRLLAHNPQSKTALAAALRQLALQTGASSAHLNFLNPEDQQLLIEQYYLPRIGEQFHWFNRDYKDFDDFLCTLSSRKRKMIRRERREAAFGLSIKVLRGDEISEAHWDAFWAFYQDTGARKWGHPYLTRAFFSTIADTMASRLLMIVAERNNTPIAAALNFIGGEALYGRYWGCSDPIPFLHYELCYYQAIEFAIANKLSRVEAGAQGDHKIVRGYEPVATNSAHFIADANFAAAIERYLNEERNHMRAEMQALHAFLPFKKETI